MSMSPKVREHSGRGGTRKSEQNNQKLVKSILDKINQMKTNGEASTKNSRYLMNSFSSFLRAIATNDVDLHSEESGHIG